MKRVICVVSLAISSLNAAHTQQAWYGRTGNTASSTPSALTQNVPLNNWTMAGAASTISKFTQQNPYLMASILSAIGLGSYWALKRMFYRSTFGQPSNINLTIVYPYNTIPKKLNLCPGAYKTIADLTSDFKIASKIEMKEANYCSVCGLRHKISFSKQGLRAPIRVNVLTGKNVTLSSAEFGAYASQFTIPQIGASGQLAIEEKE